MALTPASSRTSVAFLAAAICAWPASPILANDTQSPVDRADPGVASEELGESRQPPSSAQDTALPAARPAGRSAATAEPIVAGAIRIEGATELTPEAFAPAIEPYLGRPLGSEELRALSGDVAEVARRAGYGLATAWVPRQSLVAGRLTVVIDEGRIDAVEVEGAVAAAIRRRLQPLATGRPLRTAELERRLLLAGDLAGVSLGRPRIVRRNGRNVLLVTTGLDRVRGRASVDNWGSATLGPVRARLSVDIHALLAVGDRLSIGGVVTPVQPREFQFVQAGYSVPVGRAGTEVGVRGYVGHSDAGGHLRDRDIEGISTEAEIGASHPLVRSRAASLWLNASFSLRDSHLDRDGPRVRDDRIVAVAANLYGLARVAGGRLRVRLSYRQGLDWFGATRRGDPLASRDDAGGAFSSGNAWLAFERGLGSNFSFELRGQAQLASRPLLASEEMGLGGREFLRGFDYREMSGDEGAAGSLELRYDLARGLPGPLQRLQFYLYGDAGRVTNLDGGFGGGSLASAAGGARAWFPGRFEAGIELGMPLTDGLFDDDPDPRVSFNLGSRF